MGKKRTRKDAHTEKSAPGKKRTRINLHWEKTHMSRQENTTRKIIFISLLNSEQRHSFVLISLYSSKDNYFFYPFVVCDIGRSCPLSLQFKLP